MRLRNPFSRSKDRRDKRRVLYATPEESAADKAHWAAWEQARKSVELGTYTVYDVNYITRSMGRARRKVGPLTAGRPSGLHIVRS